MLPCPHHARHLVVSAATAAVTFGGAFNDEFEDARKMEVYRQKPIFALARLGYEKLFRLADADQVYVDKRVAEFLSKASHPDSELKNGAITGIHVRRGDRHPYEFQYRDSYIPLNIYIEEAQELRELTFNNSGLDESMYPAAEAQSINIVASDDPEVYSSDEFAHAIRAQEQIKLASASPSSPQASPSAIRKFVDETVGWEGGFFSSMFWSLGKPISVPATATEMLNTNLAPTEEALRLRELVGRAYLMDLAVLGGASDRIVCTVSSMGCRLLAVMMGWERAFGKWGWVNIDGDFDWRGVAW
jgi:hypothetical protein